jgi:hypothetical protein
MRESISSAHTGGTELSIAVDRDWIKQQMAKAVSAEESVLKAERDHRERLRHENIATVYDRIIMDDERHLEDLKTLGRRYGHESGGVMQGAGGLLGGLKSAVEGVGTSDPFQTIGDDLMMKSNAVNYDHAWARIFRDIGDTESASVMEQAAREDEDHQQVMRDTLTSVGLLEARGEEIEE